MKESKTDREEELRTLALERNIQLGNIQTEKIDRDDFMKKLLQAKQLGVFLRDREMSRRIESGQIIRIATVITNDADVRKQYIEMAMPQSVPSLSIKK